MKESPTLHEERDILRRKLRAEGLCEPHSRLADLFSNSRRGWLVAWLPRVCLRDREFLLWDEKVVIEAMTLRIADENDREVIAQYWRSSEGRVPIAHVCEIDPRGWHELKYRLFLNKLSLAQIWLVVECKFSRKCGIGRAADVTMVNRKGITDDPVSSMLIWKRHRRNCEI